MGHRFFHYCKRIYKYRKWKLDSNLLCVWLKLGLTQSFKIGRDREKRNRNVYLYKSYVYIYIWLSYAYTCTYTSLLVQTLYICKSNRLKGSGGTRKMISGYRPHSKKEVEIMTERLSLTDYRTRGPNIYLREFPEGESRKNYLKDNRCK